MYILITFIFENKYTTQLFFVLSESSEKPVDSNKIFIQFLTFNITLNLPADLLL